MATKKTADKPEAKLPAPPPVKPESAEEKAARRWLRRFASRALAVDPPLQNLPLGSDGFVAGTKLLSAARGEKGAPAKLTMETLLGCVATSGGNLEQSHDEKTGISVRAASRKVLDAPTKKQFSEKDYKKLAEDAKKQVSASTKKKHAANEKRWSDAQKKQSENAAARFARREKKAEAARQRALRDPKNIRQIADPKNPTKLAKIAPPLRRVGRGTTTEDAKQVIKERK